MYRTRIERLEERKLFSVTDLIIDPIAVEAAATSLVGDFNGDGRDDIAEFAVVPTDTSSLNFLAATNGTIGPQTGDATIVQGIMAEWSRLDLMSHRGESTGLINGRNGFLLPYLEQDNLYKMITDGTSNTLMISQNIPPVDLNLLGLMVDTSPIDLEVSGIDVWEHAYSAPNGPAPNGIIAILIGLAADPTDPSGNTATGANFAFADGSVHFIGADVTGTVPLSASLLASDEYFSRFNNTTLDDEAPLAALLGNGGGSHKVTHDTEFEKWADAHHSNSDSYRVRLEDVLVSGILHEENEFSFPRMFGDRVSVG